MWCCAAFVDFEWFVCPPRWPTRIKGDMEAADKTLNGEKLKLVEELDWRCERFVKQLTELTSTAQKASGSIAVHQQPDKLLEIVVTHFSVLCCLSLFKGLRSTVFVAGVGGIG